MAKTTITIAQWGQINVLYLPVYLAIESGLLEAAGFNSAIHLAGNDDAIFKDVALGRAQFGVGDPAFCAMKKNAKYRAQVLATISGRISFYGVTHNPVISPVGKPSDLVNLRLGTFPRPSTNYTLLRYMKETNKRLLRSMTIVESPIGQQFDLLADDKADIVMDIEPFVSVAESKGYRVVYSYAEFYGPFAFTGFFTTQKVIDQQPAMVAAMVNALEHGFKIIHDDHAETLLIAQKYFPKLDPRILKKAIDRLRRDGVWQSLETKKNAWKAAISMRRQVGDRFIDDIYTCVDNSFLSA